MEIITQNNTVSNATEQARTGNWDYELEYDPLYSPKPEKGLVSKTGDMSLGFSKEMDFSENDKKIIKLQSSKKSLRSL